jgi:hypothetical protein
MCEKKIQIVIGHVTTQHIYVVVWTKYVIDLTISFKYWK